MTQLGITAAIIIGVVLLIGGLFVTIKVQSANVKAKQQQIEYLQDREEILQDQSKMWKTACQQIKKQVDKHNETCLHPLIINIVPPDEDDDDDDDRRRRWWRRWRSVNQELDIEIDF